MTSPNDLAPAPRLAARLGQGRRRTAFVAALLMGMCAALGQAPIGAWPLSIIALGGLFGLFRAAPDIRRAAWIGWAGGTGYFIVALSWIIEPFLVDIARHGWMAPFALFFLASGLAFFWMAGCALAHRAGSGGIAFVSALTLAEALRGRIFTGFPWAQPGHIWIDTSLAATAAYAGALGLTIATLALAVLIWRALEGNKLMLAAALLGQAAILLAPITRGPVDADAPTVRLIQPNAPQHEKWDPDKVQIFFDRQLDFTRSGARPDLVVWPETAIPTALGRAEEMLDTISDAAGDVTVVLGALRFDGPRLYNAMAVLDGQGRLSAVYDKHHLVPFGEYLPFGNTLGKFGLRGLAADEGHGYSSGPGPAVIDMGRLGKALPLICYEGVFPHDVSGAPERADFMLLITNDAWFGDISGPYQHLAQARLRSIEQGLPMVRAANTGVSAMIDARGQITAYLPLGQAGFVDAPLPAPLPPTVYSKTGDLPILLLLLIGLGGAMITRRQLH